MTHDVTAPDVPVISVQVDDVEEANEEAKRRGYEIVHALTTEPWGVRRFFVRAPDSVGFVSPPALLSELCRPCC